MRKKSLPSKENFEENRDQAFNYSLKYLSYRARSIKEVYDYLVRKNFVEDTINAVLKKLIDLKFLDDVAFAKQWIDERQRIKGKSKFVIKNELRLKGLSNDTIEPLLEEAKGDFETARLLFEKKKKTLDKLPPDQFKRKMAGFLQRRGFSFETIIKLFKQNV